MQRKLVTWILIFFLILTPFVGLVQSQDDPVYYWKDGWLYRKLITFDGEFSAGDQVNFNVTYTADFNESCQSDFDDLRFFTLSDVPMRVWLEQKANSNFAELWFNSTDGVAGCYVYYGNSTVPSDWADPEEVFPAIYQESDLALFMPYDEGFGWGAEESIASQKTYGTFTHLDDYFNDSSNTGSNITQSFTLAGRPWSVSKIGLYLFKSGSPTVNLKVQIFNATDYPTGSPLAVSQAVNASTLGESAGWVNFTISGGCLLSTEREYALLISESGEGGTIGASDYVGVCSSDSDLVTGEMYLQFDGTWYSLDPYDMEYEIFGQVNDVELAPTDRSDNAYSDCVFEGDVTWNEDGKWTNAVELMGDSDDILLNDPTDIYDEANGTVCLWLRADSISVDKNLFTLFDGWANLLQAHVYYDHLDISFVNGGSSDSQYFNDVEIYASSWYFLTIVQNGSGLSVYLNGTLEEYQAKTFWFDDAGVASVYAYLQTGAITIYNSWDGRFNDFMIFHNILNATQIADLAANYLDPYLSASAFYLRSWTSPPLVTFGSQQTPPVPTPEPSGDYDEVIALIVVFFVCAVGISLILTRVDNGRRGP